MSSEYREFTKQLGVTQVIYSNKNDGVTFMSNPVTRLISAGSYTRTSIVTPNYRREIKAGNRRDLPMNPFSFISTKLSGSSGRHERISTRVSDGYWTSILDQGFFVNDNWGVLSPVSSVLIDLDMQVTASVLKGLKDQTFNVGIAVGEGKQTVDLIANKAKQIAGSLRALRKGNFREAAIRLGVSPKEKAQKRSRSRSLAQNWLELQYGWKPLLSDIYGACEFLAKQHNYVPRSRIQKSAKRVVTRNPDVGLASSWGDTYVTKQTDLYEVKYIIYFSEPIGGSIPAALGLTNPLSVAWELVPFSFLADWFLPIGSYIDRIGATHGLTFLKGCKTTFWRGTSVVTHVGQSHTWGGWTNVTMTNLSWKAEGVNCSRSKLQDWPTNYPPTFKNPFSGTHLANAIALIASAVR